ncbi:MAG: helix-turn-helix domain-containing protein [Phycisphaerales bacterium]|nr:helix-turn-helix domain-containing protein [Phycisphaerales bacterium]MCI0630847.1 helix-turn-helix domain-containing protein [Phycisphaerales bacterium]MCI0674659.1 helix-turn-helix domain-containing protein [Phycisphaerales bacterium]
MATAFSVRLKKTTKLARRFEDLVHMMAPQAIADEIEHERTVEVIDRLMAAGRLTKDQERYLETLVQLVEVYEAAHHEIDTSDLSGLDTLKHLMDENQMSASDLARVLDVHVSMGSKILKGERALTVEHLKKLSIRFKVGADAFID